MQLEPIRAILTADSGQFVQGMNRAHGAVTQLSTTSAQSSRAMNVLKNGLVGLATQATGTQGPVGKLAQGLLLLGGGSTTVLAVAAGIGAISLAYRALTRETREAEAAQSAMLTKLKQISVHGELMEARAVLARLQTNLEDFQKIQRNVPTSPSVAAKVVEAQSAIATQLNEIAGLEQKVAKWQQNWNDEVVEGNIAWENFVAKLRAAAFHLGMLREQQKVFKMDRVQLRGADPKQAALAPGFDFEAASEQLGRDFRNLQHGEFATEVGESFRKLGLSAGKQFALAIMEGVQSMQDLMKSVLLQFLSLGLDYIFGGLGKMLGLGSATGVIGGQEGGHYDPSVVAPAQMSLNMNMSGLQPLTAFAIARDPNFQQVIRESILVAAAQGFKG